MNQFKVWAVEDKEEDFQTVSAVDAEEAAKEFVEEIHADLDYAEEQEVVVQAPDGAISYWKVTAEATVVFSATRLP